MQCAEVPAKDAKLTISSERLLLSFLLLCRVVKTQKMLISCVPLCALMLRFLFILNFAVLGMG